MSFILGVFVTALIGGTIIWILGKFVGEGRPMRSGLKLIGNIIVWWVGVFVTGFIGLAAYFVFSLPMQGFLIVALIVVVIWGILGWGILGKLVREEP